MNAEFQQNHETGFEKAYQLSLRFLGYRARSVMEIIRYLIRKEIPEAVIDQVIEKLKSYNYLNDEDFAEMFIENRKKFNPRPLFALEYELSQKGIHDSIIQRMLKDETDEELAWRSLSLKWNQWRHLPPDALRKKGLIFLKNRGFGYEASLSALEKLNICNNHSEDIENENQIYSSRRYD